jgi:hypothetical protein
MNKRKLTASSTNKAKSLPQPPGNSCESSVSTNTKGNGEKNELGNGTKTKQELNAEFWELAGKVEKSSEPKKEEIERLRQLVLSFPEFWHVLAQSTGNMRNRLIEKISRGIHRAFMLAEVDILKKQFGYDEKPPLEQLLIDHILTAKLRLIHVENCYNNLVVNQSVTLTFGEYWDGVLTTAENRYLRAIEMLARVRRLARNTPALQINIAREGGKQVNVQGDTLASGEHPASDP